MSWFLVFLGLCTLIVLHEAGHFVAAKATGMRVERFFLFFGPTIWSFKRGETEYGIKAIPLGGYVRITGMNPEEEIPEEVAPRAYYNQPVWKRIVTIAAGPAVNIVLAFVILYFVAFSVPKVNSEIGKVETGSPAAAAHLQRGDRIVAVDGKHFRGIGEEERLEKFGETIASHKCPEAEPVKGCRASTPVKLTIERGGQFKTLTIYPAYDPSIKRTRVGITYGNEPAVSSVGDAGSFAAEKIWQVTSGTFHVFSHIFEAKQRKEISGIVGTSDLTNEAINTGAAEAFLLLAIISLSLGLINLLPILPLDGGHIFWSLVEKLRGKRVSLRTMERASVVGFALIAMLFVLGLSNDIGRITGEGFKVR